MPGQSDRRAGGPLALSDLVDSTPIDLDATSGKLALVATTATLPCNGSTIFCSDTSLALILDLVGYGASSYYEGGAAAPSPSATSALARLRGGCTDINNNGLSAPVPADFLLALPVPRSSVAAPTPCGAVATPAPASVIWQATALAALLLCAGCSLLTRRRAPAD